MCFSFLIYFILEYDLLAVDDLASAELPFSAVMAGHRGDLKALVTWLLLGVLLGRTG